MRGDNLWVPESFLLHPELRLTTSPELRHTQLGSLKLTPEQKSTPSPRATSGYSLSPLPWELQNLHLSDPNRKCGYDWKRENRDG